jgi:hypothetical protein
MELRVKVFTNEVVIHNQIAALEDLLGRKVDFEISLNANDTRSNLTFHVSESELQKIKYDLGYNVLIHDGKHWLPYL